MKRRDQPSLVRGAGGAVDGRVQVAVTAPCGTEGSHRNTSESVDAHADLITVVIVSGLLTHGHLDRTGLVTATQQSGAAARSTSPAALASLDRLAELPMALFLPGHGAAFADGPQAATTQARHAGQH